MITDQGQVTAVLGPTNTGKTHLAVERMLARRSGIIGLPLRLLAREVYDRVVAAKGPGLVALVTGEEKIVPKTACYFICTIEAMPMNLEAAFIAIDEVQLAADRERGHVFTDRLLHARGTEETMLMGAGTMGGLIRELVPEAVHDHRERFSELRYIGPAKLTRLPRRSAVVAFSAESVYALAELIRRRRGGAAVVMGGLSPRTRNAQVELYQSGEVDFLVATDAIGMGLNMDVEHVAFAETRKFDGHKRRPLMPAELAQIAGRAGRFRNDGTFGETADCPPLTPETVKAIEDHRFAPVRKLQWRNPYLDENSLDALIHSLDEPSPHPALERSREAMDERTLKELSHDKAIQDRLQSYKDVQRLWDACRLPDFRKATLDAHARLVKSIFMHLTTGNGYLPNEWLEGQLERLNKTSGEVDTLASRLSHVRTWAYAAHRADWTEVPEYWREKARNVEDALSDALHEKLMLRFVDRRTQALVKGLRDESDMLAGISETGEVTLEGHYLGRLDGLVFRPDIQGKEFEARTLNSAALKALRPEINARLNALTQSQADDITLEDDGHIVWRGSKVARLSKGDTALKPAIGLVGGELGAPEACQQAISKLEALMEARIKTDLAPLFKLNEAAKSESLPGVARGIAWRLHEAGGALTRHDIKEEVANLAQPERRALRTIGVQIGEHVVFIPGLVKPRPARLNALLRGVFMEKLSHIWLPAPGLTSLASEPSRSKADYAACGFFPCGPRAVRLDILEKLADLIRDARSKTGFALAPEMVAVLGCSVEDLRGVLTSLRYRRLKTGPDPEKAEGEVWGMRGRRAPQKQMVKASAKPVDSDNPFSVLAGLSIPTPDKPKRQKRKPRKAKKPTPDKTANATPSP